MTDIGRPPRPVVALYTTSECWRGASVSYVRIARGLEARGYAPQVVAQHADVADEYRRHGLPVTLLEGRAREARRLRRTLTAHGAQAVIVDRAHDLRVGARAAVGSRVALVMRYNLFRPTPPTDLMTRLAYGHVVREVVFLSEEARHRVLAQAPFMRAPRAATIPEGLDTAEFAPSRAAEADFRRIAGVGASPYLLAVGALEPEKRYDLLLDAVTGLGDAAPPLVVCGEGGQERALRERATAAGVDVRFVGRVPQAALVGAYTGCSAFVHACDVETFGLAVAEAMACARPVVAAAGGALPEVVGADGSCGMLVEPRSSTALSAALRSTLRDRAGAEAMGARARARVEARFSLEAMQRAYAEVVGRHVPLAVRKSA